MDRFPQDPRDDALAAPSPTHVMLMTHRHVLAKPYLSCVARSSGAAAVALALLGAGCSDSENNADGGECTYDSQDVTIRITSFQDTSRGSCDAICGASVTVFGDVVAADGSVLVEGIDVANSVYQAYVDSEEWDVGTEVAGRYDTITDGTCTPTNAYIGQSDFSARGASEAACAQALVANTAEPLTSCAALDCVSPPEALVGAPCDFTETCDPGFVEDNVLYECSEGTYQAQQ